LALVLGFVGAKMLISEIYEISITVSLGVITFLLSAAVLASFVRVRFLPTPVPSATPDPPEEAPEEDGRDEQD